MNPFAARDFSTGHPGEKHLRLLSRVLIAVVVLVAIAAVGFFALAHKSAFADQEKPPSFDAKQIEAGKRIAAAGNCAACHTTQQGKPYAGGLPIETNFGTIYSSNITPDRDAGIGKWSLAAFTRAMREGVAAHGTQLYPAFPYDHYTHMNDEDIGALYAFIMTRDPVAEHPPRTALRFPYSFRPLMAGWKMLYLNKGPLPAEQGKSADWTRGRYLVEALGHCGSCHTPRNSMGAEVASKAYDGGESGGWWAPPLNAASPALLPWKAENIFNYLRSWDADHGGAHGPMAEVTTSMKRMPEADVRAISTYVADRMSAMPDRTKDAEAIATRTVDAGSDKALANGKAIFDGACARCHESGGQIPFTTRTLGLHTNVQGPDPRNVINVVLHGIPAPEQNPGAIMPGFPLLDDAQVADLLAYVRKRYTNAQPWPDVAAKAGEIRRHPQEPENNTSVAHGGVQASSR
jgi:mono/diheme cytochrome c family protein